MIMILTLRSQGGRRRGKRMFESYSGEYGRLRSYLGSAGGMRLTTSLSLEVGRRAVHLRRIQAQF